MITLSRPAQPGAIRRRPRRPRLRALVGSLAVCVLAIGAAAGDGIAGSGDHAGGSSSASTFADSAQQLTQGSLGGGSSSSTASALDGSTVDEGCLQYPASCYVPQSFRTAYGIQALLDHGIDGRGQTVVLPEVESRPPVSGPDVTDIRQDLAQFDGLNHIPAATLQVVTTLATGASPYLAGFEEVEDVEIVHAVAPAAAIDIVLLPPSDLSSPAVFIQALTDFLQLAESRGNIVSISASLGEHFVPPAQVAQLNAALQAAQAHHVTVVASSGDTGAASDLHFNAAPTKEVSLPAADPLVLAAGATSLALDPATGAYSGEIAPNSSGGGFSHLFSRPGYQDGVARTTAARGVPDVAADGDAETGMALVIAAGNGGYSLFPAGGTSAAAPLWAGVIALADQYAGRSLGFVNPAIYRIAQSSAGHTAFHDITVGNNSVVAVPSLISGYQAAPGWDPVTGWGSPDAQVLVPLLAHDVRPGDAG